MDEHPLPVPFEDAIVADVMSLGVISCSPETPLRIVARMMSTFGVHCVFVFEHRDEDDEDVRLWRVISALDLVVEADRLDRTAAAAAVTPLVTVRSDAPLAAAASLMGEHAVGHLAVVEPGSGRPVGVVSTLDITRSLAVSQGVRETQPSG